MRACFYSQKHRAQRSRARLFSVDSERALRCALLLGLSFMGLGVAASAQNGKPAIPRTIPRRGDGKPNLEGFWTNSTSTPLERPKELGAKEFYTPEEAAAVEKERRRVDESQSPDDIHYDNRIWQDEEYSKTISNRRTSMIFDPPDGRIPPLSEAGKKQAALVSAAAKRRNLAESAQDRTLAERCISWGNEGPPMIGSTYNANLQILETPGQVVISHEIGHAVRAIPVDGRPHVAASIHEFSGDSRGRWEGDTLVVDSTNFSDKTPFRGPPGNTRQDIFTTPSLHVVERFTMTDANTITYRFTVEDPGAWTRPWSGELMMRRFSGPIFEYACHEGNYGLVNILAGARAAEAKAGK